MRKVATAIGVVIGAVIFDNKMEKQQDTLRSALGPRLASSLSGDSAGANVFLLDRLPEPQKHIVREVFYKSVQDIWIATAAFAGVDLLVCFFIKRNQLNKQHQEVRTGLAAEKERSIRVRETRQVRTNRDENGDGNRETRAREAGGMIPLHRGLGCRTGPLAISNTLDYLLSL